MSMRYPGGLIATSPVNAAYPSGVWTPSQSIPYQQQNVWTRDQYWPYTTLLLNGNGTNGAQNNTFLDSSTNNFTITRNGNTTQGSFTPYEANGYWSNYFDGSGDYLTTSSNTPMDFGTGNFTIEGWFFTGDKSVSSGASRTIIGNSGNSYTMQVYISTSGFMTFGNTGSTFLQGSTDLANNAWHHFAISRSGTGSNQIAMWVDGTRVAQGTNSQNYTSGTIYLGGFDNASGFWNGYVSNLRIVKGTAVYDPSNSTITVPTSPLTAITNTSLLTCQSNRFIDNSASPLTITVNGNTSVQAFQPFPGATTWSGSVLGGSGYFDGTGDYLNGPSTGQFAPTGDFTISMWFYPTSFAASYYVLAGSWVSSGASDEWLIQYDNAGAIRFLTTTDSTFSATGVVKLNQWQFLTVSRSGSTVTGYINGTSFRSYTLTGTVGSATKTVYVGIQAGTTWPYVGWISDYRLVSGSAQSATPPTSPATAISGTNTLLNFTNAGIFDSAMMNDLETVGNAQVSTSVVKYGTGSMAFDGSGDYLKILDGPNLTFGSGDFTVEAWVYPAASPSQPIIVGQWSGSTGGTTLSWCLALSDNANRNLRFLLSSNGSGVLTDTVSSSALTLNAWNHVALVRNGSVFTAYLNGIAATGGTYTISAGTSLYDATNPITVGESSGTGQPFNGYIDDLRITKGAARYIGNFTPPPARLPPQ